MHAIRRIRPPDGERIALDVGEYLRHRDAARRRRRHATHSHGSIGRADGCPLYHPVHREIGFGEVTRVRMCASSAYDVTGNFAGIKGRRALCSDGFEGSGVARIFKQVADRPGLAIGAIEIGARCGVFLQKQLRFEHQVQPSTDRKTRFREPDGGRKESGPLQLAVRLVNAPKQSDRAGHANAFATDHGIMKSKRQAVATDESLRFGGGGCGLATVVAAHFVCFGVMHQQKRASSQTGALRLDETEHQLRGNHRVHRAATRAQHFIACVGGQRVGGGNPLPREAETSLLADTGCGFGRLKLRPAGCTEGDP